MQILLVNPPIYDFAAYDFWLKPYGLLSVAGFLRGKAQFTLFDYLDRAHPLMTEAPQPQGDQWGRGRFRSQIVPSPGPLAGIPRHFRRFGLPRSAFQAFLAEHRPFDAALVQTTMTYWYPGVREVIEDIREARAAAQIVLGGNYVTLCGSHAQQLGADLLVHNANLEPLWRLLECEADPLQPAAWETYDKLRVGALKLSDGCPFQCTYCSVPNVYGGFRARPRERALREVQALAARGAENIAFYDDALLADAEDVLGPFLEEVLRRNIRVNLHSPNALNARLLTRQLAELMVRAGFRTFYLGLESISEQWQRSTGAKVCSDELADAVHHLLAAGADPLSITAYQILGHPKSDTQQLEASMHFVRRLGIRGMLADFSPIPGTSDGHACRKWVDMDEPLLHNKTAFPIIYLGFDETNRLKDLQRTLNRELLCK